MKSLASTVLVLALLAIAVLLKPLSSAGVSAQDIGSFWHIPDIHLDDAYAVGSASECILPMCCRRHSITDIVDPPPDHPSDPAGPFGEPKCDAPLNTVLETLRFVASHNPDFVLNTGDIIPHDLWNQTKDIVVDRMKIYGDLLKQAFGNQTKLVFNILGDHDSWPYSQMGDPDEWSWLLDPLVQEAWNSTWLNEAESQQFRTNGGYYSRVVANGRIRLIGLNGIYGSTRNVFSVLDEHDPSGQLDWLEAQLQETRAQNQTAYLLGHFPYGVSEYGVLPAILPPYQDKMLDVVQKYTDVLHYHMGGHLHVDTFRIVRRGSSNCLGLQILSPSVTPWDNLNVAVREFRYNRQTGEIVDMNTYYFDLEEANQQGNITWKLLYSTKAQYNLTSITCDAFDDFRKAMFDDDTLWETFRSNYDTAFPKEICASDSCRARTLCEIGYVEPIPYGLCVLEHETNLEDLPGDLVQDLEAIFR